VDEHSGPPLLASVPRPFQVQIVVGGPLLAGAVCGFLLGETEVGWWVANAAAALGGLAGGFDHLGTGAGLRRGLLAGSLFGIGVVAADAISGDPRLAQVPSPLVLLIALTTIVGGVIGAIGGTLRARYERRRPSAPNASTPAAPGDQA
jgi:hypothetical protein